MLLRQIQVCNLLRILLSVKMNKSKFTKITIISSLDTSHLLDIELLQMSKQGADKEKGAGFI